MKLQDYLSSLLGQFVKFRIGRRMYYGRVMHITDGVANIRGIEQSKGVGEYNAPYEDLRVCTHDEVYRIGAGKLRQTTYA